MGAEKVQDRSLHFGPGKASPQNLGSETRQVQQAVRPGRIGQDPGQRLQGKVAGIGRYMLRSVENRNHSLNAGSERAFAHA